MTINQIADHVINELRKHGVVIQRYDACNTNSIYLKFDYGVANSLRISDHTGKRHLKYRYNILSTQTTYNEIMDKYVRYYFPVSQTDDCIRLILKNRQEKIDKYGFQGYLQFMQNNKNDHNQDRGFWRQAKLLL